VRSPASRAEPGCHTVSWHSEIPTTDYVNINHFYSASTLLAMQTAVIAIAILSVRTPHSAGSTNFSTDIRISRILRKPQIRLNNMNSADTPDIQNKALQRIAKFLTWYYSCQFFSENC